MKKIGITLLIFIITMIVAWFYFAQTYPVTSPLKSMLYFAEHLQKPQSNYKNYVIGFLPYWRLNQIQFLRPNELSELNYFSLSVATDRHILKIVNDQSDPG